MIPNYALLLMEDDDINSFTMPITSFQGYRPPQVVIRKDNRAFIAKDNRAFVTKDNRIKVEVQ